MAKSRGKIRKQIVVSLATHKKLKVHSAKTGLTAGQIVDALLSFLPQVKGGNATKKK